MVLLPFTSSDLVFDGRTPLFAGIISVNPTATSCHENYTHRYPPFRLHKTHV